MNRIFNWVFGSFFRTLGRILVYILIAVAIMFLLNKRPKAITSTLWGYNVGKPLSVDMFNCTSSSCRNAIPVSQAFYGTADATTIESSLWYNAEYLNISTYGFITSMRLNQELQKNYLYSLTLYTCHNYNFVYNNNSFKPFLTSTYDGALSQPTNTLDYVSINYNNYASTIPFEANTNYFNTCRAIYMVVSPANNSTFFSFRLNGNGNTYSNVEFYIIGYDLTELGIYSGALSDEVETIISNSGFATSTSVEQVQNSVNEVQQEMEQVNSSIDNQTQQQQQNHQQTMDTITDDSGPSNLDSLSNAAGWLPAGPVDSILNLPLSFLTNLNSNLSKSCQPVELPLPFIDKTLPLPCINSLYSQIEGVPAWQNTIGIIASAFIMFSYLINLYKYIDDTLTFRENNYIDNWSGV